MTGTTITRFRPDAGILRGLAWRAGLVVVAAAAVLVGLPAWARAPLSIAAALVTVLFVLRRVRMRGPLDSTLTALGVVVALLALLGLLLNVLPPGITEASWGLGIGIIELAVLVALVYWRAPRVVARPWMRRVPASAMVWAVLVAGVLTTALLWSIASFNHTHVAPLAVAAVQSGDSVVVTVSSGRAQGPYELEVLSSAGRTVIARDIRVGPGHPSSVTLAVPANTRETVQLVRAGSDASLRKLILDTTSAQTKAAG
jgi:hypothetical protein